VTWTVRPMRTLRRGVRMITSRAANLALHRTKKRTYHQSTHESNSKCQTTMRKFGYRNVTCRYYHDQSINLPVAVLHIMMRVEFDRLASVFAEVAAHISNRTIAMLVHSFLKHLIKMIATSNERPTCSHVKILRSDGKEASPQYTYGTMFSVF
jgi:hypothetical protein